MRISLGLALIATTACSGAAGSGAPPGVDLIREDDLRRDLFALAGDHFRGREAGTLDELRASVWLAEQARAAGLEPAGDDSTYFQFWPIARMRNSSESSISVGSAPLEIGTEAIIMSLLDARVDAPLVYVGDGRPNSLRGRNVRGRAVVVQLGPPDSGVAPNVSLRPVRYGMAATRERVQDIAPLEPAAIVMVVDATADSGWSFLAPLAHNGTYGLEFRDAVFGLTSPVPVIWVRANVLPRLQQPGGRLRASLTVERFYYPSVNVVAKVPGTDAELSDEYVLFSAHQDHDGIKPAVNGDSIWNGADDNGSVSVGILAIGRAFAQHPARRSALFVWHGAEEKGLLGSRYHAEYPVVPKESIVAVLNADMIGANHPDTAALLGVQPPNRNSQTLVDLAFEANDEVSKFVVDTTWDSPSHPERWYTRSDHLPYARADVPAIYFSSLPHPKYHTPEDEPDAINYPKLTRITRWMYATGWKVANRTERVGLDPKPASP